MKFLSNKASVVIVLLTNLIVNGQTSLTFNGPIPPNQYKARDEIKALPNASAQPTGSNEIHLYIDKEIQTTTTGYQTVVNTGNTAPDIDKSLPVGTTAGSHGVSSVGQATYDIPIVVPPGTKKLSPSLGISYNSGSYDGVVGRGWSIRGLSVISRSALDFYHDLKKAGVTFTSQDKYVLDGQRLMNTSTSGQFRLENESFSLITSSNNSFTVQTKDGLTMLYGTTADSKLKSVDGEILAWYLNEVRDNYGNHMVYTYYSDEDGEKAIKEIKYTENVAANIPFYNSIKFYYDKRNDITTKYLAGETFKNSLILREINVSCEEKTMKTYQFKYANDVQPFLNEVIEYGSDYSKLNSTIITYGDKATNYISSSTTVQQVINNQSSQITPNADYQAGDFNGDGKTDLLGFTYSQILYDGTRIYTGWELYINQDDGSNFIKVDSDQPANFSPYLSSDFLNDYDPKPTGTQNIDVNGDGMDDLIVRLNEGGGYATYKIYYSNGNGFNRTGTTQITIASSSRFVLADIDGDARPEAIELWTTADLTENLIGVYWLYNNTHAYALSIRDKNNSVILSGHIYKGLSAIDFNGDGVQELYTIRDGKPTVFSINVISGTLFNTREVFHDQSYVPPFYTQNYFGDFNGDNIIDNFQVLFTSTGPDPSRVKYGTGTGYTGYTSVPDIQNTINYARRKYIPIDINNDGKTDFVDLFYDASNNKMDIGVIYNDRTTRASIGSISNAGFPYNLDLNWESTQQNPAFFPSDYNQVPEFVTGDFNGDGRQDIMFKTINGGAGARQIIYFNKDATSHLIRSVTDGFRNKAEFTYKTLANAGANYTKGSGASFPVADLQIPMYVVTGTSVTNGIGGENSMAYKYEGAKLHLQGRGLLGFDKTTITNNTTSIKTVSEYGLNTTYYERFPVTTKTYVLPSTQIAEESYTVAYVNYTTSTTVGNRHFTKTGNITSSDLVSNKTVSTDFTYDNDGNLLSKITNTNNGYEIVTQTYTINPSPVGSWIPSKVDAEQTSIQRTGEAAYTRKIEYQQYNSKGDLEIMLADPDKPAKSVRTQFVYDPISGVMSSQQISAPNSSNPVLPVRTSLFGYDHYARFVISNTNPLNQLSTAEYDPRWGKPVKEVSVDGLVTQYTYDGYGKLIRTVTPDNLTTYMVYSWVETGDINPSNDPFDVSANALYSITTQRKGSPVSKSYFDMLGRTVKSETDGLNSKLYTVKSYDAFGKIFKESAPYKTLADKPVITTHTYTADLHLPETVEMVSDGVTHTTTMSYTYPSGNTKVTTVLPDNKTASQTTDPTGLLLSATDNLNSNITYEYYSNRRLKRTKLNNVQTNYAEYDEYGNQTLLDEANSGVTAYIYNAYGLLASQTDANSKTYTMEYDAVDRMTKKYAPDGTYDYTYVVSGNGLNNIKTLTGPNNITYNYTYDNLRRNTKVEENISGQIFTSQVEYDEFSNVKKQTYPGGFAVENVYNDKGIHIQTKQAGSGQLIWQADEINHFGQYSKYTLGNNVQSQTEYTNFGLPKRFYAPGIQDLNLVFNETNGNLDSRKDAMHNNITENFLYDGLDRLYHAQVAGQTVSTDLSYYPDGNINTKTGIGYYTYHGVKKNAVVYVENTDNLISITQKQLISYTPFNKTEQICEFTTGQNCQNGTSISFTYGPDLERKKTELYASGSLISTRYFLPGYEKTITGSTTTEINYISCGSGLVAMYVVENGVGGMNYVYKDHLGSILKAVNQQGATVAEQSFDAWGNYRDPITWQTLPPSGGAGGGLPAWLYRGFTGHEHLPVFGLINMNGRMYDPTLGRMLSPDIFAQAPDNSQNHNRYSYALNNPLKFIDPSGNSFDDFAKSFLNIIFTPFRVISEGNRFINDQINGRPSPGGYFNSNYILNGELNGAPAGTITPINDRSGLNSSAPRRGHLNAAYSNFDDYGDFPVAVPIYGQSFAGAGSYLEYKGDYTKGYAFVESSSAQGNGGTDFSLAGMYMHFQFGGGNPMYINASSIDFSGTNQRQLGLDKIGIGKTLDPVNLFNAGINSNSLAFGRLSMTRVSETQFSIAPNMFDFDYQSDASWQRNAGTILGGMINYNLFPGAPFSPLVPLIFGGPYNVIFNGTVTIPK